MLAVILALFALAVLSMFTSRWPARAAEGRWDRWNVAPYASSQEDACRKAPTAIDGFNMPSAVKQHFKSVLGTICKDGKEGWLTPHMLLEQMWSGGLKPHVMNRVTVGELPVLRSPDGRSYHKGTVAETAKALSWEFAYEGQIYVLHLPFVCYNWTWMYGPVPLAPIDECYELEFSAPVGGKSRWGITTKGDPLPPSACNAQKQGDGAWTAWYGECDTCVLAGVYIERIKEELGVASPRMPHKYLYPVTSTKQTLRFSSAVTSAVIHICLENAAGKKTCGVVLMRPQDWKGRHSVTVPDIWLWEGDPRCPPQ